MEYLTTILQVPLLQLLGFGLFIVILQRAGIDIVGLVKTIFGKNGNGNKVTERLDKIEGNDLEHIQKGIDEIKETGLESLFILRDIREMLKK